VGACLSHSDKKYETASNQIYYPLGLVEIDDPNATNEDSKP
jgi:hypothetical protein